MELPKYRNFACSLNSLLTIEKNIVSTSSVIPVRYTRDHKKVRKLPKRFIENVKVQSKIESLTSKGFLRNLVTYTPPKNAPSALNKLFLDVVGTNDLEYTLNLEQKFQLLSALSSEFSYTVPSSLLYRMTTLGHIQEYYLTRVENITPYDEMKEMELPPNLHVVYDYHRFHPDSDTMFNGVSAFPRSSTIVTGLKSKEKYKGHDAGNPFWDI